HPWPTGLTPNPNYASCKSSKRRRSSPADFIMRLMAIVKVAFRALRRNKLRTVLTMLGIIIGVGAVITMVALGRGAKAQVQARIAALGQNVIQVFSGSINRSGVFSGFGGAGTLTVEDAQAIVTEVPGVVAVSPE